MIDIDLLIHGIEKEKCLRRTNINSYVDKHSKQKSWIKFYKFQHLYMAFTISTYVH